MYRSNCLLISFTVPNVEALRTAEYPAVEEPCSGPALSKIAHISKTFVTYLEVLMVAAPYFKTTGSRDRLELDFNKALTIRLTKCNMADWTCPASFRVHLPKHQSQQTSKHKQVRGNHLGALGSLVNRNIPCKANLVFTSLVCRYELTFVSVTQNDFGWYWPLRHLPFRKSKDNQSGFVNKSHLAEICKAKFLPDFRWNNWFRCSISICFNTNSRFTSNRTNRLFLQVERKWRKRQCLVKMWTCFQNEYWIQQALQRRYCNTLHTFPSDDIGHCGQYCWLCIY